MTYVRQPAVADLFYPGHARDLRSMVDDLLADAAARMPSGPAPKAIIVPHAGYVYSGPVAASAYVQLAALRETVRRVVLIGPSHRVPLRGLSLPTADAFATPLGEVPIDRSVVNSLLDVPQVHVLDVAHAQEHSLEVHLPFLQTVLEYFKLVPLAAGDATADEVADVLERVWGGPETLVVVSSDLSHYLDYDAAQRSDAAACRAIEALDPAALGPDQACGRVPIAGLLAQARRRGLRALTLDLRNSGDTAGSRRRVVGYGAWLFAEPAPALQGIPDGFAACADDAGSGALRALLDRHGTTLLHLAAASIAHGLRFGEPLPVVAAEHHPELRQTAACFVTLRINGDLRGCIGTAQPYRPLIEDVAANAYAAAFHDHRFASLASREARDLAISLSVLGEAQPLSFADEADLLRQLRPGRDGVIFESEGRRSVFLPQVWEHLREPVSFLAHLKQKAGLPMQYWDDDVRAWRFSTQSVSCSGDVVDGRLGGCSGRVD